MGTVTGDSNPHILPVGTPCYEVSNAPIRQPGMVAGVIEAQILLVEDEEVDVASEAVVRSDQYVVCPGLIGVQSGMALTRTPTSGS